MAHKEELKIKVFQLVRRLFPSYPSGAQSEFSRQLAAVIFKSLEEAKEEIARLNKIIGNLGFCPVCLCGLDTCLCPDKAQAGEEDGKKRAAIQFCKSIGCSMMDSNCPGNLECDIVKNALSCVKQDHDLAVREMRRGLDR